MTISEFKEQLKHISVLSFQLPNGQAIPAHFHITEMGIVTKSYIDCGGKVREEKTAAFQLWEADDFEHCLSAEKLLGILAKAESLYPIDELEIQVEYQQGTISKFRLTLENGVFQLINMFTDCLAKDKCGIPTQKKKLSLVELGKESNASCTPDSGCC